ncbi:hypothetical protein EST38_g14480, partial [Candolleomyces aberdarensis]
PPSALGQTLSAIIGTDFRAFGNLTHWYMSNYNRQIENNPSVRYFSWAGFTEVPTPLFTPVYPSSRVFGQTDGLVNTSSAVWDNDLGPGTHLGTVEGLDHVAVISATTASATIPHLEAAQTGGIAPVIPIENNLMLTSTRQIEAATKFALAPTRAMFGIFGLGF